MGSTANHHHGVFNAIWTGELIAQLLNCSIAQCYPNPKGCHGKFEISKTKFQDEM